MWREQASTFTSQTCIQGGTMSSAPAANTSVEHSGASDDGCAWLRRGGGAWHVIDVCVTSCHALFDANHHISADKALSASHAQRSGAMVLAAGAWWHGARPVC